MSLSKKKKGTVVTSSFCFWKVSKMIVSLFFLFLVFIKPNCHKTEELTEESVTYSPSK